MKIESKYQNKRTFIGRFMYNLAIKSGLFLSKHMWLWYVLNLTWGLPLTLIGAIVSLFVNIKNHAKRFKQCIQFDIGDNWGGLSMSFFMFIANNMGEDWTLHTKCHEYGHSFQNAMFGPFFIFIVAIPSVIRYWTQIICEKHGKKCSDYDMIWFEGAATDLGMYLNNNIK